MKKRIKKKLSDFMRDESGAMSKENILKVGVGAISALGILSSFTANIWAQVEHINYDVASATPTVGGCYKLVPSHISYDHKP